MPIKKKFPYRKNYKDIKKIQLISMSLSKYFFWNHSKITETFMALRKRLHYIYGYDFSATYFTVENFQMQLFLNDK